METKECWISKTFTLFIQLFKLSSSKHKIQYFVKLRMDPQWQWQKSIPFGILDTFDLFPIPNASNLICARDFLCYSMWHCDSLESYSSNDCIHITWITQVIVVKMYFCRQLNFLLNCRKATKIVNLPWLSGRLASYWASRRFPWTFVQSVIVLRRDIVIWQSWKSCTVGKYKTPKNETAEVGECE